MLDELMKTLSPETHRELAARGITYQLLCDWRKGRRLPTEIQVADLADVTGADWAELQAEITVLRAPEARRQQIAKAIRNSRELRVKSSFLSGTH